MHGCIPEHTPVNTITIHSYVLLQFKKLALEFALNVSFQALEK